MSRLVRESLVVPVDAGPPGTSAGLVHCNVAILNQQPGGLPARATHATITAMTTVRPEMSISPRRLTSGADCTARAADIAIIIPIILETSCG